jgi:quinol monooxygenase YgiN
VTADPLPPTAVIRVSRGNFDPARFAEVQEMTMVTGRYLIPAIKKLPGLISYHAATSPDGSLVHVSIWESDEHADQMSRLKEMIVDARAAGDEAGVTFTPIINYPIDWTI